MNGYVEILLSTEVLPRCRKEVEIGVRIQINSTNFILIFL